MYLLKLALRPWRRAPLSQFFSATVVGLLLFLVVFLFWMEKGLSPILARLQGEQVITAYLDQSVESKEESKIVDLIKANLGMHPTLDVKLINGSQFIHLIKKPYPELARELDNLGAEANQVIPRYISITGIFPESSLEKIGKIPGIEKAESSKDRYRQIVGAFSTLRWVARILMLGILMALLTGLIHLARMNAYLHRDALTLLKFWGANRVTLYIPGTLSGLSVGVFGGILAALSWLTLGTWLINHVRSLSPFLRSMSASHPSLTVLLVLIGAVGGSFAGVLGGFTVSSSDPLNESSGGFAT